MSKVSQETECCPKFKPSPWNGKILKWNNKRFIKDSVFTFLNMPMNFGAVIGRMAKKIEAAGATMTDWLCLSDHTSPWNMDLYIATNKTIPNAKNTTLSGKFLSKVYEGDFKETAQWCKDFESSAERKRLKIKKWYMWYTTCPKCAKKYGKNYVVIIGEVVSAAAGAQKKRI